MPVPVTVNQLPAGSPGHLGDSTIPIAMMRTDAGYLNDIPCRRGRTSETAGYTRALCEEIPAGWTNVSRGP